MQALARVREEEDRIVAKKWELQGKIDDITEGFRSVEKAAFRLD